MMRIIANGKTFEVSLSSDPCGDVWVFVRINGALVFTDQASTYEEALELGMHFINNS